MTSSAAIRVQVEAALAHKIPSALTPVPRTIRPFVATGIIELDTLIQGGFPVGAITELVGEECSGRTSVALSFLSRITAAGKLCAWIDTSNSFNPSSAASVGVDLKRLLWVRSGVHENVSTPESMVLTSPAACSATKPAIRELNGGGHGTHPRSEVKGLSAAVDRFLGNDTVTARGAEPIGKLRPSSQTYVSSLTRAQTAVSAPRQARVYSAIEQALRSTDLLLQAGGFGAIVLDLGSVSPEVVSRIELSTWHRYRVASEQTQSSIVLLSQYPCTKSSSELQLHLFPMENTCEERTVFTGMNARVEMLRQRFTQPAASVVPICKPSQRVREACWNQRTSWAGPR